MESPVKPRALAALVAATVLIAAAYASAFLPGGAPPWAPWLMIFGTAGVLVSMMALGASRRGTRLGPLRWVFALVFVLVTGSFALALLLPPEEPGDPLVLGLPMRAAVVLLGVGLLPLFLVPVAYAVTFDRVTLSEAELARIRAEAARLGAERAVGGGQNPARIPAGDGGDR
jgi:phosphatidylglycerophosphate synthase